MKTNLQESKSKKYLTVSCDLISAAGHYRIGYNLLYKNRRQKGGANRANPPQLGWQQWLQCHCHSATLGASAMRSSTTTRIARACTSPKMALREGGAGSGRHTPHDPAPSSNISWCHLCV